MATAPTVQNTSGYFGKTEAQLLELMQELQDQMRNAESGITSHSENGSSTAFQHNRGELMRREHTLRCALFEVAPTRYSLPLNNFIRRAC